ncbi:hypothetical protein [Mycobacteroides abscessus]
MSSFYVEISINVDFSDPKQVARLDELAEAVADLADVDADLGIDKREGVAQICITLSADGPEEAITIAAAAARTAIHGVGGRTDNWERIPELVLKESEYRVRPSFVDA